MRAKVKCIGLHMTSMSLYLTCSRIPQSSTASVGEAKEEIQQSHVAQLRHDALEQDFQGGVCSCKLDSHTEQITNDIEAEDQQQHRPSPDCYVLLKLRLHSCNSRKQSVNRHRKWRYRLPKKGRSLMTIYLSCES